MQAGIRRAQWGGLESFRIPNSHGSVPSRLRTLTLSATYSRICRSISSVVVLPTSKILYRSFRWFQSSTINTFPPDLVPSVY
jgi:hypothetical protein